MALEIDLLRSFVVASETLNFSEAGMRLGRVQSAISAQIGRLEDTTGTILFERGRGKSMTLTPSGEKLLAYAHEMLRLNAEALSELRPDRFKKVISFGTTETYALTVLPRALSLFAALEPSVETTIACARSTDLMRAFDAGELDLVLVTDQGRQDGRRPVRDEPLVWVAGRRFRLLPDQPLPVAFMPAGCEFRHAGLRALDAAGMAWRAVLTSESPTGIRAALHAGIAATVMPKASVDDTLRVLGEAEGLPPLGTVSIVVHTQRDRSDPPVSTFVQQIMAAF